MGIIIPVPEKQFAKTDYGTGTSYIMHRNNIDIAKTDIMKKAYTFRIYPNKNQEVKLNRTLSTCRHLYNEALDERKRESELNNLERDFGVFPWGKPQWIVSRMLAGVSYKHSLNTKRKMLVSWWIL